jgi:hypothetical protein
VLGRQTLDNVTTLGTGADGHVLRQRTTYASGGQVWVLSSGPKNRGGSRNGMTGAFRAAHFAAGRSSRPSNRIA